jgi:hypothetical protein
MFKHLRSRYKRTVEVTELHLHLARRPQQKIDSIFRMVLLLLQCHTW